jgi:hypothetical protein
MWGRGAFGPSAMLRALILIGASALAAAFLTSCGSSHAASTRGAAYTSLGCQIQDASGGDPALSGVTFVDPSCTEPRLAALKCPNLSLASINPPGESFTSRNAKVDTFETTEGQLQFVAALSGSFQTAINCPSGSSVYLSASEWGSYLRPAGAPTPSLGSAVPPPAASSPPPAVEDGGGPDSTFTLVPSAPSSGNTSTMGEVREDAGTVNLRWQPTTSSPVEDTLTGGTQVILLCAAQGQALPGGQGPGGDAEWVHVTTGQKTGLLHTSLLVQAPPESLGACGDERD